MSLFRNFKNDFFPVDERRLFKSMSEGFTSFVTPMMNSVFESMEKKFNDTNFNKYIKDSEDTLKLVIPFKNESDEYHYSIDGSQFNIKVTDSKGEMYFTFSTTLPSDVDFTSMGEVVKPEDGVLEFTFNKIKPEKPVDNGEDATEETVDNRAADLGEMMQKLMEEVKEQLNNGVTLRSISNKLGISEKTIKRWVEKF